MANGISSDLSISSDGATVAYWTLASNLVSDDHVPCGGDHGSAAYNCPDWVVWQRGKGTRFLVADAALTPLGSSTSVSLAADGQKAVVQTRTPDGPWSVVLVDVASGLWRPIVSYGAAPRDQNASYCPETCGTPRIDPTGRFVLFDTYSPLDRGDTNADADFFLHDLAASTTERVSVAGSQAPDGNSFALFGGNAVSADGHVVVFSSTASDLDARDRNTCPEGDNAPSSLHGPSCIDVFLRWRDMNRTELAVVSTDGASPSRGSWLPSMDAAGRRVAFQSASGDLVAGDANGVDDVFVLEVDTKQVRRVSLDKQGEESSLGSYAPQIDTSGRRVLFLSKGRLAADDADDWVDIHVADLETGLVSRVSRPAEAAAGDVWEARMSPNGEWVVYTVQSPEADAVRQVFVSHLPALPRQRG